MNFEEMAEIIGYDQLSAEIVDGKMIIEPADAGVMMMAYLQLAEEKELTHEREVEYHNTRYDKLRDENAHLRDFLERVYVLLTEKGLHDLAQEVILTAYPISGVDEETGDVVIVYGDAE